MITSTYSIAFTLQVGDSHLLVPLTADVEVHHSETHYVIKNIKAGPHRQASVLPDLKIKKVNGLWVHIDSEKESHLSRQVGNSIERRENETAAPELRAKSPESLLSAPDAPEAGRLV